jgi:hypothetical protein
MVRLDEISVPQVKVLLAPHPSRNLQVLLSFAIVHVLVGTQCTGVVCSAFMSGVRLAVGCMQAAP